MWRLHGCLFSAFCFLTFVLMPKIKKKIRKKDADQRRMILDWFKSKGGQEALQKTQEEEYMTDPYGRPISVMLPEAEVSTLGNKDRDLASDVLKGGALAAREVGGLVPFLGEALDVAELKKIAETGEDYYGNEADPKMYAGMTAAGLLLPNLIERPAKGAIKLLKKGFQKLKGSGPKALKKGAVAGEATPAKTGLLKKLGFKGPKINTGSKNQSPNEFFAPSALEPYSQRTDIMNPDRVAGEGSEFVRRYFADPQVQQHYRHLVGEGSPSSTNIKDAVNVMYDDAAQIQRKQSLLGEPDLKSPDLKSPERIRVEEIAENEFGGDYERMFQESEEAVRLQRKHLKWLNQQPNQGLREDPSIKVYRAALHPDFDSERLTQTIIDGNDAVALEALFLRGQRSPDPSIVPGDEYMLPKASGQYTPANESVLMKNRARGNKSIGTHETQHFADFTFLHRASKPGSANPNPARKVLDGLSESVSPAFKNQVINNESFSPSDDFVKYLANPVEITARTREAQRYLADALLNNPTGNSAVGNLSRKERVAFLLGDFSVLDDSSVMNVFNTAFKNMAKDDRRAVIRMFDEVIDGGKVVHVPHLAPQRTTINMSGRKKEAISNLFKYALATTGAGAAYGAMDSDQQPPQGMSVGGKFKVKKKTTPVMRVKKSYQP